jgi:protein O-mannosyl-transferase
MLSREITINRKQLIVCGSLLLITLAVFGQTIRHEFISLDDGSYVFTNPLVWHGLSGSSIVQAFTSGRLALWVPMTWISLMIDWNLYDVHAGGYHLTNVLLHATTAILLCLLLQRMTGRLWPSVFVAALFAVHPLRVESVAWVTERKDVLSGVFFMLTLMAYVSYARRPFSLARYVLTLMLFALGLMAKPMLVTVPGVLLLLDYWPLQRMTSRTGQHDPATIRWWHRVPLAVWLIVEKIPFCILAVADSVITVLVQDRTLTVGERLHFAGRIGQAAASYVFYLSKFFYPIDLALVYPRRADSLPLYEVLGALALLAAITVAAVLARRRCPYFLVGWLWFLVMLLPMVGLVRVGITGVADRCTYLPQIGLAMVLAWGAADLCGASQLRRRICGTAAVLVLAIAMVLAFRQTSYWCDSETLWQHTIDCTSDNAVAEMYFGDMLIEEGRYDDALVHVKAAMALLPYMPQPCFAMGRIAMFRGELARAEDYLSLAVKNDPSFTPAYARLGLLFYQRGRFSDAISNLEQCVAADPQNCEVWLDIGRCFMALGKTKDAKAVFLHVAHLSPDCASSLVRLGLILASRHRFVEAIENFQRVIDVFPRYVGARLSLARVLADQGRVREALAEYEIVLKIDPNEPEASQAVASLRRAQSEIAKGGAKLPKGYVATP